MIKGTGWAEPLFRVPESSGLDVSASQMVNHWRNSGCKEKGKEERMRLGWSWCQEFGLGY